MSYPHIIGTVAVTSEKPPISLRMPVEAFLPHPWAPTPWLVAAQVTMLTFKLPIFVVAVDVEPPAEEHADDEADHQPDYEPHP